MVFALLFAWAVKVALIEPFAIACMLQSYFKAIEGQRPDPTWAARLDGMTDKFRKMGEKAAAWVAPKSNVDDDATVVLRPRG